MATKRLIRSGRRSPLRSHLADEGTTISLLGATDKAIQALSVFAARRQTDRTENR
jgi:hypothetical protein